MGLETAHLEEVDQVGDGAAGGGGQGDASGFVIFRDGVGQVEPLASAVWAPDQADI